MSHPDMRSTDIKDHEPPSPAPTYRSTFYNMKDSASLTPSHRTSPHPSRSSPAGHGKPSFLGDKRLHKNNRDDIELVQEPFDTNHPHYVPPAQYDAPRYERPVASLRQQSRYPPLKILVPWVLFAIFFLLSTWYTSIAFGVRLFTHLNPQQPIQIFINDGIPGESSSPDTPVVITGSTNPLPPPTPTPTTSKGLVNGNGVDPDLGSNTVTSKPPISSSKAAAAPERLDRRDSDVTFTKLVTAPVPGLENPERTDSGMRGADGKLSGFATVTLK